MTPADDSVGVCSITQSFRFILVVELIPFINLDSAMPIKLNSIWSWLIKYLKVPNCLGREATFRWNNERGFRTFGYMISEIANIPVFAVG